MHNHHLFKSTVIDIIASMIAQHYSDWGDFVDFLQFVVEKQLAWWSGTERTFIWS